MLNALRHFRDVPAFLRRFALLGFGLFALLFSLTAHAEQAVAAGSTKAAQEHYGAPADQPHLDGTLPSLPSVPPSFNTHDGGWIRFAYPPATRERIQPLIADADRTRSELRERLGQSVLAKVQVYIARTPGEMSTLAPEGAPYPKYASGVAYSQIGLVLLTLAPEHPNALHDLQEIFRHELAHVALYDAVEMQHQVPRWFNEGFAVHASGESSLSRLQTLWTATLAGDLIPLSQLERGFPADPVRASVAYAEAADLVRFLLKREDTERFRSLIRRLREGQAFDGALSDAYGLDHAALEYEWRQEVAKRYSFWPVFFSGTLVWMGVLGLFVIGWRRRRRRSQQTLDRWSREEAMEDARRARTSAMPQGRVHIVFPAAQTPELPAEMPVRAPPDVTEVPKVEHEGRWHTLH